MKQKDVYHDLQYFKLVGDVLRNGVEKTDRTGVGTIAVFGRSMRFDLSDGTIPLLTTKAMHIPSIIHEVLWYLSGSGNVKYLQENGVRIWNEWADENGDLGPVYGVQWRKRQGNVINAPVTFRTDPDNIARPHVELEYEYIDQIARLVDALKTNPTSRRLMVDAWNPADVDSMALPPCHYAFQCYAAELSMKERITIASKTHYVPDMFDRRSTDEEVQQALDNTNVPKYRLSLLLNMRSNDVGLGNPFNIAQYSILLRMLCEVVNMAPGDFIYNGGDVHIYSNHVELLREQLVRVPMPSPTLTFNRKVTSIDDFKFEDFSINNYKSHPAIKMKVAV